ncbi:alpha/beta hydrolase [Intrasporangium oryzae NRRL B-24470]|uniref:Alpha/beta hydrolase n=1 Tax=Intrasporangium oryzae NRRL B-24470 TaxID=1386089 RepID=W9G6S2_9MICO|nr:alpha/beta hydrolase [Intrasporangium oryzae]EWT01896.1 alpha/beta hydrolase [Intrasporangium oryzae NRRL B-24470]
MTSTSSAFAVELPEGSLAIHDLTLGVPSEDAPVVLAVHGITANGLSWRRVADEVDRRHGAGAVRFLAPDLRGRGDSRAVAGPYGLSAHVEDLLSIANVFGTDPVLVGHSMGAFIGALALATHPDRFTGAVLVDGGLAFRTPPDLDIDATLQTVIGPAMDRLRMTFADQAAYVSFWEAHPALGPVLRGSAGDAARRYIAHDLVADPEHPAEWRSTCVLDAVRADGADVLADAATHGAVRRAVELGLPVELVWARRGLLDEPQGVYDETRLAALQVPDEVRATAVDANHYDVIFGESGVTAVVDAIDRQLAARTL